MGDVNIGWHEVLRTAKLQQQQYYELLSEWTKYEKHEYKYLLQNIAFAIFGPPSNNEGIVVLNDGVEVFEDVDITEAIHYTPDATKIIERVYQQVVKYGDGYLAKNCIYYGLIYNIIFQTMSNFSTKANSNKNVPDASIQPLPVFKVARKVKYSNQYEAWYIDMHGRVYKSWSDYKKNNNLPEYTMVLPWDGTYQPDPNCQVSEEYSTVWLDVTESEACKPTSKVIRSVDAVSNVSAALGIGLGIASFFTPAAPITIGATVLSGINGLWVFGRSANNLKDRNSHGESINITNRDALCSWIAVGGSVFGLAATGGSAAITKCVQKGTNISTAAKFAYNATLVGNLGINGVGIAYQAYNIYTNYQDSQNIRLMDVASLAAHVLFFGNSVIKFKFAGDLIATTQGEILEDYRDTLRSKQLRRAFKRAVQKATARNADEASARADVVRYINRRSQLQSSNTSNSASSSNGVSTYKRIFLPNDKGVRRSCTITLLNPMMFVDVLIYYDKDNGKYPSPFEAIYRGTDVDHEDMFKQLRNLLEVLLNNTYQMSDAIIAILDDMKYLRNGKYILTTIFNTSVKLINLSNKQPNFLDGAIHFVWHYIKECLRQTIERLFPNLGKETHEKVDYIICNLCDHMEASTKEFVDAFVRYAATSLL